MKRPILKGILSGLMIIGAFTAIRAQSEVKETVIQEKLLYHPVHLNAADQTILPWYSTDLGKSYDFAINQVWNFWNTMRTDKNGLPYYMNHQVWRGDFNDRRGVGGDQFAMALSSWNLYYGYSGNELVKEEMKFIPYPYNTLIYSGIYDGDMVIGPGFTQPDKAGSFGLELVKLYKMTNTTHYPNITDKRYLDAAIKIANTLAKHIKYGVTVVNEQTAYRVPGNSHSSRQASADLQYAALTGDQSGVTNAIRTLNWATYMVDHDGKNCYPRDEVWMTDGYGDYVRHYLRAMAFLPELAPTGQNHLLSSTSIIQLIEYQPTINKFYGGSVPAEKVSATLVHYRTFDNKSIEILRLAGRPQAVTVNNTPIPETDSSAHEGWSWNPLGEGGVLTVKHLNGNEIAIFGK